jgi:hypothetical protein
MGQVAGSNFTFEHLLEVVGEWTARSILNARGGRM